MMVKSIARIKNKLCLTPGLLKGILKPKHLIIGMYTSYGSVKVIKSYRFVIQCTTLVWASFVVLRLFLKFPVDLRFSAHMLYKIYPLDRCTGLKYPQGNYWWSRRWWHSAHWPLLNRQTCSSHCNLDLWTIRECYLLLNGGHFDTVVIVAVAVAQWQ